MADSQVNRGKGTQNTRVQRNDDVSKRIAAQNQKDRSTVADTVKRINGRRDK